MTTFTLTLVFFIWHISLARMYWTSYAFEWENLALGKCWFCQKVCTHITMKGLLDDGYNRRFLLSARCGVQRSQRLIDQLSGGKQFHDIKSHRRNQHFKMKIEQPMNRSGIEHQNGYRSRLCRHWRRSTSFIGK